MRALIVDDDELSLELLQNVLIELGYDVECALDGREALNKLRADPIHIVITDWEMPEMNGLELCRAIREQDFGGYVFIIMLTCRDSGQQRIEGIHGGADAFLAKPLNPEELLVSLKTAERILGLETRDLAMFALAKLSESRDPETGAHVERVQSYARVLAQNLSTTEKYSDVIDSEFIRLMFQTSPLHDIGKVGIPDNILLKPGRLTDEEMSIMRTHASLGAQTLDASLQRFPNARFLQMARDIAIAHHERWDGKGYPQGLAGEQIPLAARIVALADVYDAVTSRRVYRESITHGQAKSLILKESGSHFDPAIVEAFLDVEQQFITIRERYQDEERSPVVPVEPSVDLTISSEPPNLVMVVDDDPIVRDLLKNFLHSQGMDCVICESGEQALEMLDTCTPRLIMSDWEMPEMDGLELCRRVRVRTLDRRVQFIMLTVRSSKEDLARAFDAGVDDFLAKPFNDAELMVRLRSGMHAVVLHDELSRQHQSSRKLNEQLTSVNHRLEKLAITDDLTGLFNRRQAIHRLEEHWSMCDRYHKTVSIICFDIDHFKQVNDVYGHIAGDIVLKGVADSLRDCVRGSDIVCRIGGEEFLVILPCQTAEEAAICAERCRASVEKREFVSNGMTIRTTMSGGIASRRADMTQCPDLLKEADEALYSAKRAGRNVVRLAPGDSTPPQKIAPAA